MDLFDHATRSELATSSPLANRMRPQTIDEFCGQGHIVGPGRLLRRAIAADQLSSLIFYGPPGTGKTTLAAIIANTTESQFITINAVLSGIKEIRVALSQAERDRGMHGRRTTLFVDEVHRWNKAQQDALLPHVESGLIILIGTTTENPYFEVNKALVSRSRIFQLRPLQAEDLRRVVQMALADDKRGYGTWDVRLQDDALEHLIDVANGDARTVLNALELAVETTEKDTDGAIVVDLAVAEESIQRRAVLYDKEGDVHYDTISAFIKSLRGSDPDAALYWMAKMIYAGEDPRFVFRRMAILAGEDVGLADPQALSVVMDCWQAFERIGMPEGRFHLSQAALYLATCPKSNSTMAFFDALKVVGDEREGEVPNHLKDGSRDKEGFGHGEGYAYPHAYRDHWVAQQYLPTEYQGRTFYKPSNQGYEAGIAANVARKREAQLAAMMEQETASHLEILTTSPRDRRRDAWLGRVLNGTGERLGAIRDALFDAARLQRHDVVLDLHARTGLLMWEAVRRVPEGGVWALCREQSGLAALHKLAAQLPEPERPTLLHGTAATLVTMLTLGGEPDQRFDAIVGRDALDSLDVAPLQGLRGLLQTGGRLCLHQRLIGGNQRLHELIDWPQGGDERLRELAIATEQALYSRDDRALWSHEKVRDALTEAGWQVSVCHQQEHHETRVIATSTLARFFSDDARSYRAQLLASGASTDDCDALRRLFFRQLDRQTVRWRTTAVFVVADAV